MNDSLLPRIDMARTTMRPAEAQVAAIVLAKPDWTLAASTSQLAEAAGVSPASVVRFCRALGMSGYRELRTELARDLSLRNLELERSSVAEGTITLDDSLAQMITKSRSTRLARLRIPREPSTPKSLKLSPAPSPSPRGLRSSGSGLAVSSQVTYPRSWNALASSVSTTKTPICSLFMPHCAHTPV